MKIWCDLLHASRARALPAHFLIAYFEEMSAESQELTRHYVNSIVRRRRIKFEMLNHTMHFSHG
jgi:hypothetical protein